MINFDIEITIKTAPEILKTEIIESASLTISAQSYNEALEKTFAELKVCNTFQEFMDKVTLKGQLQKINTHN